MQKKEINVKAKVIFSDCFKSGHKFYTAHTCGVLIWGFLAPEDEFQIGAVCPNLWSSQYEAMPHTNFACVKEEDHETYHQELVGRLKESNTFCPSRLRKHLIK